MPQRQRTAPRRSDDDGVASLATVPARAPPMTTDSGGHSTDDGRADAQRVSVGAQASAPTAASAVPSAASGVDEAQLLALLRAGRRVEADAVLKRAGVRLLGQRLRCLGARGDALGSVPHRQRGLLGWIPS